MYTTGQFYPLLLILVSGLLPLDLGLLLLRLLLFLPLSFLLLSPLRLFPPGSPLLTSLAGLLFGLGVKVEGEEVIGLFSCGYASLSLCTTAQGKEVNSA